MKYLAIFFLTIFLSCTNTKNTTLSTPQEISFATIKSSENGGFENKTTQVISSKDEFEKVWKQAWVRFSDAPEIPTIDFSKKQVLLIAIGAKNNGGFGLEIDKIVANKTNLTVNYIETKAGENCMTTQAIVFPFELIEIEKTSKKIVFSSSEKINDCK